MTEAIARRMIAQPMVETVVTKTTATVRPIATTMTEAIDRRMIAQPTVETVVTKTTATVRPIATTMTEAIDPKLIGHPMRIDQRKPTSQVKRDRPMINRSDVAP